MRRRRGLLWLQVVASNRLVHLPCVLVASEGGHSSGKELGVGLQPMHANDSSGEGRRAARTLEINPKSAIVKVGRLTRARRS